MINPNPRHRLAIFVKLGELLDIRAVGLDRSMTSHAFSGRWQSHVITWIRHFMAILAFQLQSQVLLVAIWDRLGRTCRRVLRWSCLSTEGKREQRDREATHHHASSV